MILGERKESWLEKMPSRDLTAENILDRLSDTENCPDETLTPYQEFVVDGKTYFFNPGGFLFRRDPGAKEAGGFFCGYLTDKAWRYRTDDG